MSNTIQLAMFTDAEESIRQKVNMAFAAKLSPVEQAVLKCLMLGPSFGKLYMIGIDWMQISWRSDGLHVYDDRSIKGAVKSLLENYSIPIGSSRQPGCHGYWLIVNDDEAEEASRPIRNEIFSMFRRLKVISPKSAFVRGLQGQMDMLGEEVE